MPRYWFEIAGDLDGEIVDLPDDQAAWSQLVRWSSELLGEFDGSPTAVTEIEISVSEEGRPVGKIRINALRSVQ